VVAVRDQRLRVGALACFGLICVLTAATALLARGITRHPDLSNGELGYDPGFAVTGSVLAVTALVLCWLRPRNAVGWLLGLSALLGALCNAGQVYGARALVLPDSGLPLGSLVLSWSAPLWLGALLVPATLVLARYPTGMLAGRWHRRIERATVVLLVMFWVAYAGSPSSVTDEVPTARPPVVLPRLLDGLLFATGGLGLLICLLVTVGMTVRRMLRAEWPERPQLALLLVTAPVAVGVIMLVTPRWVTAVAFLMLPVAVVVGVLRYRLLGIEVVLRRTLLYVTLTGIVLVVFAAVTAGVTLLVPKGPAPTVLAASAVAVLLVPARDRLQRLVDRFVYGERNDPWRALGRLGRGAGTETATADVVASIAQSMGVAGAELRATGGEVVAWGEVPSEPWVQPLVLGEVTVGELWLAPRRGQRDLDAGDRRLLDAITPLLALVVRSTELARELRVERERVVAATEAERARLRRDLHDGLGPSLTGIGLGLEAMDSGALPERLSAVLRRVRTEVGTSLDEVRRIIEDLAPGALDASDLLTVVRQRAQHVTATTGVRVDVEAPDNLPVLPPTVQVAALRILDEALNNVVRHAGATACRVELTLDEALHLAVTDDGRGYTGPRQGGVGLPSMRSRAAALGGRLDLTSSDAGTRLSAELPVAVLA
jgi:signal transduction histidine kinase